MTTYFETKTDSGSLQITDNQPMLYLLSKTNLSSYYVETANIKYQIGDNGSYATRDVHIYTLPMGADPIFIGAPSSGTAHVFPTNIAYAFRWNHYNPYVSLGRKNVLGIANVDKSIADNMKLYTFTQGNVQSAANVGLECYDENGNKIYSIGCFPMKILYATLFTHCPYQKETAYVYGTSYTELNVTHNFSGKTIAFSCPKSAYFYWGRNPMDASADLIKHKKPICLLSDGIVEMATITKIDSHINPVSSGYDGDDYPIIIETVGSEGFNQTAYSIIDVTNY